MASARGTAGRSMTRLRYAALGLLLGQVSGAAALYVRWGAPGPMSRSDVRLVLVVAIAFAWLSLRLAGSRETSAGRFAITYTLLALSTVMTMTTFASALRGTTATESGERTVAILAINDVYRIEGAEQGKRGGLARLRALRRELEARYPGRLLVLHAGDVLFPSFLSRMYDGAQMIDALNMLDGYDNPEWFDDRLYVAFGNHEFEKESCDPKKSPVLQHRVRESQFFWLHSNIAFTPCADGRPRIVGSNVLESKIVQLGGLRVGLVSLTIDTKDNGFEFKEPIEAARHWTAELRRQGADVVVAVTHLPIEDDRKLYDTLKSIGLDLVVGGHDHTHMSYPTTDPRVFKADADAVTAWVLELSVDPGGALRVKPMLRQLDETAPTDPAVASRVSAWLHAQELSFCRGDGRAAFDPECLSAAFGSTKTQLDGGETEIRERETSLGNWIADQMLVAFAACRPVAAVINSGSLRLNQNIAANTTITRRHVEELVQYATPLKMYELDAGQLRKIAAISVGQPGSGGWLQMSGLSVVYDARTRAVTKLRIKPPGAATASIDLMHTTDPRKYRIVTSDFVATGTDGFTPVFAGTPALERCAEAGVARPPLDDDLKTILIDALKREKTISPVVNGRICTTDDERQRPCLAGSEQ